MSTALDKVFLNEALLDAEPKVTRHSIYWEAKALELQHIDEISSGPDHPVNARLLLGGKPFAFLQGSSALTPDALLTAVINAKKARSLFVGNTRSTIPVPICEGRVNERSYAVWPLFQSLPDKKALWRFFRARLSPRIRTWIRQLFLVSLAQPTLTRKQVATQYRRSLEHVAGESIYPYGNREAADRALLRLNTGKWVPRCVLMHGDLWKDNVMLQRPLINSILNPKFVVIDWPGAECNGYPFYDLIRVAESFRMSKAPVNRDILFSAKVLDCELEDVQGYLAAAFGHYGLNTDCFPKEHLCTLMDRLPKLLKYYMD